MAALSDPRAFMGAAKERSDNMKSMGIEEAGGAGQPSGEQKKVKVEEKVEGMWIFLFVSYCFQVFKIFSFLEPPLVFEPITVESLRQEKGFQKTGRKQQKELDMMRKRHAKEKMAIQKAQCAAIEKLIKGKK